MAGGPELPRDAGPGGAGEVAPGRPRWRWAGPVGLAVVVAAIVVGVRLVAGGPGDASAGKGGGPAGRAWTARFLLTAGSSGDTTGGARGGASPWFQVHALAKSGRERLVESVRPPAPDAGAVQEILAGPAGTFVLAASRAQPCESRLYRFRLTAAGHPTGIAPVPGSLTPALVAGLAISPDGRRIAYTTAPCAHDPWTRPDPPPVPRAPRPVAATDAGVSVLDLGTGARRAWTAGRPSIVGEIVWARDSRTVGYTFADLAHQPPPPTTPGGPGTPPGDAVREVTVRALDAGAPGTDLLAGRVLFHQADGSGMVTSAVMGLDGRTGYGVLRQGQPATTILFAFTEGQPIRVTSTFAPDPHGAAPMLAISSGDAPRYACLSGIDAFGRVIDGVLETGAAGLRGCGAAYDTPR